MNSEFFFNRKTHGPVARSGPWWTEGGAYTRHDRASLARSAPGAAGLQSSPTRATEDEDEEAKTLGRSAEHEQWQ
jgi:hypothetical protein